MSLYLNIFPYKTRVLIFPILSHSVTSQLTPHWFELWDCGKHPKYQSNENQIKKNLTADYTTDIRFHEVDKKWY